MFREFVKLENGFTRMRVKCQSTSERDHEMSVFPHPMPSTHRLVHRWINDMEYEVYPEQIAQEPLRPAPQPPPDRDRLIAQLNELTGPELEEWAAEQSLSNVFHPKRSKAQNVAALVGAKSSRAD